MTVRPLAVAARAALSVVVVLAGLLTIVLVRPLGPTPVGAAQANAGMVPAQPNSVQAFGTTQFGDLSGQQLNRSLVGMADTADGAGYWLVGRDGGIFSFGDAAFHGSTGSLVLNQPIVGMAGDPATGGYWTVASDGGVFSFDSPFFGSTGSLTLNEPIVGMAVTPDGGGYWLVASDGGIFSFGDAPFFGSTGSLNLNQPIVGMAATADGLGYWMVARDGGIFTFGGAAFFGSAQGAPIDQPITGMTATPDGGGYWLVARDGSIFHFGDATEIGAALGDQEVPAIAITAAGAGYRVAYGDNTSPFGAPVTNYLAQRAGTVTAAVYDANTGATWVLNPDQIQITASIVKVDIMATAFAEAEAQDQPVPPAQIALMYPMIEVSDNNAATALWYDVGGAPAVTAFNQNLQLTDTIPSTHPITPNVSGWAFTTTSAADQVKIVSTFAFHNPVLTDGARAFGLSLMEHITPSEAWGIPADTPAGVTVALKTGLYPLANGSQVNSIGYVHGAGHNYVFAFMATGAQSEADGAATLNGLATLLYDALSSD